MESPESWRSPNNLVLGVISSKMYIYVCLKAESQVFFNMNRVPWNSCIHIHDHPFILLPCYSSWNFLWAETKCVLNPCCLLWSLYKTLPEYLLGVNHGEIVCKIKYTRDLSTNISSYSLNIVHSSHCCGLNECLNYFFIWGMVINELYSHIL